MSRTLAQIAQHIQGTIIGKPDIIIRGVGTLTHATAEQISFLANPKYKKYLQDTDAGAVIVSRGSAEGVTCNLIEVDDPYVAYAKVASLLHPAELKQSEIHATAWVHPDAVLAENVYVGAHVFIDADATLAEGVRIDAGCVIEAGVKIGSHSWLRPRVTLCHGVTLGERVQIHPGVVIGADGFGIANDNGKWIKVPQVGGVIIGNDVEIGANTTIDRGAIEDTLISDGVKLDNQIQIGHNVVIGEHTVIAGCVGIAGSTKIGAYCAIGGGAGMAGHIEIADGVQLTGMSMVTKSIAESGVYSSGIPVEPTKQWHKNVVRYRQLDTLFNRVRQIEKQLED